MTKLKTDCYEILQLNKETATESEIKKAYRKLALKYHPDKLGNASEEEKVKANDQFQQIGFAYTILSDPKRKKRYDTTGSTDENFFEGEKDWTAYFKELWTGIVSAETIEEFKKKYQGSDEERRDVFNAYNRLDGNMEKIMEVIECSETKDEERFIAMIQEGIKNSELKTLKHFKNTTVEAARKKRIQKERKEMNEASKQKNKKKKKDQSSDIGSLALLIQQKNQERANKMMDIFESMEKRALEEQEHEEGEDEEDQGDLPTDEEFNRIQERLMKRKNESQDNNRSKKKSKKQKA